MRNVEEDIVFEEVIKVIMFAYLLTGTTVNEHVSKKQRRGKEGEKCE